MASIEKRGGEQTREGNSKKSSGKDGRIKKKKVTL